MSTYEHPELVALDEVEDILEAYAEARLSPSGPILTPGQDAAPPSCQEPPGRYDPAVHPPAHCVRAVTGKVVAAPPGSPLVTPVSVCGVACYRGVT